MSRRLILSFVVVIGLAVELWAGAAAAQAEQPYEESLQPGLRLSNPSGSVSDGNTTGAVRRRPSIDITSGQGFSEPPSPMDLSRAYTVRAGDTLWDICERLMGSSYSWPMIWSYNPEITNPHWIYPGQNVYLSPERPSLEAMASDGSEGGGRQPLMASGSRRGSSIVTLRNRGFVDTKMLARSGSVVGSHSMKMVLGQHDTVYAEFKEDAKPTLGDEFAVYEVLREVEPIDDEGAELGKLVEVLGLGSVTSYDPKTGIARFHIDESFKPFERGAIIGPVHRHFDVVPPVTNEKHVMGHLVALLDEGTLAGSEQIVFVDRGQADGVRQGNRFLAVEKRDKFRESRKEDDDSENYPYEVLAELRVLEARRHTSTCLVLGAVRELEVGTQVEMRQGH